jgi:hypothetical protein
VSGVSTGLPPGELVVTRPVDPQVMALLDGAAPHRH